MSNIFEDAWNAGKEWATDNVVEPVKDFATDQYIDYKVDQYVKSFTDEFKGPTKITPEMAAEGWKPGLDGVPYNSKLNEKFEPGGIFYDPDVDKNTAIANAVASGKVSSAEAGTQTTSPFLLQDLRQRTPSGTIYNPSMEAFENASLFDYQGPGGVSEYTYGQGLPMDYGVYGTPVGPNLYYEGQFGEGFVEPGVADSAIELPAVTMPDGVPQIPSNNASNKKKDKDLTYAETIAEMGIAPGDAPSTLFPGPGQEISSTKQANMPGFNGMNPDFLISQADQGPDIGLANYTNNGTVSAEDQARFDAAKRERFNPTGGPSIYDTQYTVGANNAMSPVGPSIYDTQYTVGANNAMSPIGPSQYDTMTSPTMIGGEEQVFDSKYTMLPTDDGSFNYDGSISNRGNFETANGIIGNSLPNNIMRNPNEETQQYRGIYVDPRTVPEIDLVQSNQTFMPSFPADYGDGSNLVTITDDPYEEDVPVVFNSSPLTGPAGSDAFNTTDNLFDSNQFFEVDISNLGDSNKPVNPIPAQYGLDEAVVDAYKYVSNLFKDDSVAPLQGPVGSTAPSYQGEIQVKEPSIWNNVMETIAGVAANNYSDAVENPVVEPFVEAPIIDTGPDLTTLMQKMSGGIDGEVDYAPGSTDAIDSIVANKLLQEQAAAQAQARAQKEAQARAQAEAAARAQAEAEAAAQAREQARARAQAEAAAQAREQARLSEQARARAQAEAAAQAKAQAAAAEKARQAAAAQKRMNDRYETGPVARAPTSAPRPSAPAGGYSTKSVNNNFATRRDIRNIFA